MLRINQIGKLTSVRNFNFAIPTSISNRVNSIYSIYYQTQYLSVTFRSSIKSRFSLYFQTFIGSKAMHDPFSLTSVNYASPRSLLESITDAYSTSTGSPNIQNNGHDFVWNSSTMKKRRSKMNKHKLRKRNKLLRANTKGSRN